MTFTTYAVALGGNRRGRHGGPAREVAAALVALRTVGNVRAVSPLITSAAMGPSLRQYSNAVALIDSALNPPAMLAACKRIERAFGRRRGQRWGARVIDLDLILWSGGRWRSAGLAIPHARFRERRFVLDPLARIAPDWRDPDTGLIVRHLLAQLIRPTHRRC